VPANSASGSQRSRRGTCAIRLGAFGIIVAALAASWAAAEGDLATLRRLAGPDGTTDGASLEDLYLHFASGR